MMRFYSSIAAVLLGACAASAATPPLLADHKVITAYAARRMVDACMAFAEKDGFPVAIAVVDPAGNLLAFQAAEGATETAILTAQLKAKTAAKWWRSTEDLNQRVNKQINRAPEWLGDFPQPGGFPIFIRGELVGAIGAGAGGQSANKDQDCAKSAVKAVFGDDVGVVWVE